MPELNTLSLLNDANLQGYWRLEDVNDSGPNGYTLTNNGVTTFATGKFSNGSNHVKASSQYLSIADASCANLEITGQQTWGCWFKPATPDATQMIMRKGSAANAHGFYITSGFTVNFHLFGLTTADNKDASNSATDAAWNFVAGRYNGSTIAIYLNGTWSSSSCSGSATDTNATFNIGASSGGIDLYNGMADDAFIFNRALTDAEIIAIHTGAQNNFFALF